VAVVLASLAHLLHSCSKLGYYIYEIFIVYSIINTGELESQCSLLHNLKVHVDVPLSTPQGLVAVLVQLLYDASH